MIPRREALELLLRLEAPGADLFHNERAVLDALGFETAQHKNGPKIRYAPGQAWQSRPRPLTDATDALRLIDTLGFEVVAIELSTLIAPGTFKATIGDKVSRQSNGYGLKIAAAVTLGALRLHLNRTL